MTKLTELEAIILGVVARDGPITAYAIAQEFATSPTSRWSGSAGAIYPAMSRLGKRGLVEERSGRRGDRPHKTYTITPAGKTALHAWLRPPLPAGVGGATEDPVRTRIFFLPLLRPVERNRFLAEALERVRSELKRVDDLIEEFSAAGDAWAVLGLEGSRYELAARIEWLRMVKRRSGRLSKRSARS